MKITFRVIVIVGWAVTLATQTPRLSVQVRGVSTSAGQSQQAILRPDGTVVVSGQFTGRETEAVPSAIFWCLIRVGVCSSACHLACTLTTQTASGTMLMLEDDQALGGPARFYRVAQP